jgi:hypothetical protein
VYQAVNQWIDQLDQRLKGKKKRVAARKKKNCFLTPADWDMLERLCGVLEVFSPKFHAEFMKPNALEDLSSGHS